MLYLEAACNCVRDITTERGCLIGTSLRDPLPPLDAQRFWQIHRGNMVRADAIATALRDESGKVHTTLRGHKKGLIASRLYAHPFKAMRGRPVRPGNQAAGRGPPTPAQRR